MKKPKSLFDLKEGETYHSEFLERLQNYCKDHSLNYHKVLCLKWQSETNKKCGNKKHAQDIYKNEMECEAQLTEGLALAANAFGATKKDLDEFFSHFPK